MSTKWRLLCSLLALGLATYLLVDKPAQLGLDLRGGTQIVLDLEPKPGQTVNSDLANRTLEVLRKRVDSLGVSEPSLSTSGDKRIIVELPGETDPTRAVNVLGSTAQLSFHQVQKALGTGAATTATTVPNASGTSSTSATTTPAGTTATTAAGLGETKSPTTMLGQATTTPSTTTASTTTTTAAPSSAGTASDSGPVVAQDNNGVFYQLGPAMLTGEGVDTATAQPPDQTHSSWYIDLKFKSSGAKAWTKLTGQAACNESGNDQRQVAIVLDDKIITHPEVEASGSSAVQCNVGITGDTTSITGTFSKKQAKELALLIRGGALPVGVSIASQQVIGPELGKSAIHASVVAVAVGGALTIAYILAYYRFLGLLAALALGAYGLISYGVLLGLGVTLTLPGIAGFVLAIAMAMDSNVLVYERVKEEHANGRSMRQSSLMGFKHALSAIIDSNATTFIAAGTLFLFAVGEVKGFGITLLIGTAVSIFTTLFVLRTLVEGTLAGKWARDRPRLLGMHVGGRFRKRMAESPPNLMRASRYFTVFSAALMVISLLGIAVKGIDFGIEFTGGRQLVYKTANPVNLDTARERMAQLGFPRAIVQRSGTSDTSIRVSKINDEEARKIDAAVKELGGTADRLQDSTVGPSFGKELERKAVKGLIIGVLAQLCWVAYRFRWTFGIGAVVAMLHDAVLTVGIFAWLSRSFDAVFLAALLTIIAYSVNDTVVVFDRIREQRKRRSGESFARVVSDACAQTFPRTVNIGLSALFILGALFAFGGETLGDFALALIIGVISGIYSSVMVASPVAVLLERWKPAQSLKPVRSNRTKVNGSAKRNDDSDDEADGDAPLARPTSGSRPAPRPRKKSSSKKRR